MLLQFPFMFHLTSSLIWKIENDISLSITCLASDVVPAIRFYVSTQLNSGKTRVLPMLAKVDSSSLRCGDYNTLYWLFWSTLKKHSNLNLVVNLQDVGMHEVICATSWLLLSRLDPLIDSLLLRFHCRQLVRPYCLLHFSRASNRSIDWDDEDLDQWNAYWLVVDKVIDVFAIIERCNVRWWTN